MQVPKGKVPKGKVRKRRSQQRERKTLQEINDNDKTIDESSDISGRASFVIKPPALGSFSSLK